MTDLNYGEQARKRMQQLLAAPKQPQVTPQERIAEFRARGTNNAAPSVPSDGESSMVPYLPKEQDEGVIDYAAGFIADALLPFGSGATGKMLQELGSTPTDPEKINDVMSFSSSLADTAALGTMDGMAAANMTLEAFLSGEVGFGSLSDYYNDRKEDINLGLAEAKEANRFASGAGGLVGSVLAGGGIAGGIAKGAASVAPRTARAIGRSKRGRAALAGTSAGIEAGIYRINSDGSLQDAQRDAGYAALGGAIFSGLFDVGASALSRMRSSPTQDAINEALAEDILTTINGRIQLLGGQPDVTPQILAERIQREGAETVFLDLYPELLPMAREIANLGGEGTSRATRLLEVVQAHKQGDAFREQVMDAITSDRVVQTPAAMRRTMKARKERLQPRYDRVFDAASNMRFKRQPLENFLLRSFENGPEADRATLRYVQRLFDNVEKRVKQNTPRGKRVVDRYFSMRDLHNMKVSIDDRIAVALRAGKPVRSLYRARNYLLDVLHQNSDEYAQLSRVYGNVSASEQAYHAGKARAKGRSFADAAVAAFFANSHRSASEMRAYAMGVRAHLLELARNSKSAEEFQQKALDSGATMDKVRSIMTPEVFDAMIHNLDSIISKERTVAALTPAIESARGPLQQNASVPMNLADAFIAGQFVTGHASGVAPMFALRRLMRMQPNEAVNSPYALSRADEMLSTPTPQVEGLMENMRQYVNRPLTQRGRAVTALGAGTGSSVAEPTTDAVDAAEAMLPEFLRR